MSSSHSQGPDAQGDSPSSGQEKGGLGGLSFLKSLSEKKTTREGNPPKRRGPKPDSKPALTRRQELNRQAQRTHRERKELYIKALEDEVLRLKERFGDVSQDKDKLAEENKLLRATLAHNGLPVPGPVGHESSHGSPSVANPSSISGSSFQQTSFTSPLSQSTAGSVASPHKPGHHQPLPGNQFHSMAHQTPSSMDTDLDQTGIDFVLTLEKPCMVHAPFLLEQASKPASWPIGHVLMASCPPAPKLESPEDSMQTDDDFKWGQPTWALNNAELGVLMNLSKQLNLDGEITPVMAWSMILSHPRFHELEATDFQRLGEELLTKVRCYGFGAVLEEFEVRDAIAGVLPSRPEEMAY